jgi:hypothetical protein
LPFNVSRGHCGGILTISVPVGEDERTEKRVEVIETVLLDEDVDDDDYDDDEHDEDVDEGSDSETETDEADEADEQTESSEAPVLS